MNVRSWGMSGQYRTGEGLHDEGPGTQKPNVAILPVWQGQCRIIIRGKGAVVRY